MKETGAAPENVIKRFVIYGDLERVEPFGSGHINRTYRSRWNQAGIKVRYIHQRINDRVFTRPPELMENIARVTGHIRSILENAGNRDGGKPADLSRRTLTVVPSREGKLWARDENGGWWRTYLFIENCHSLELAASRKDARTLGESIALFQSRLAGLEGPRLHETIPGFHNMEKRYRRFHEVLSKDSLNRAAGVKAEIDFILANEERGSALVRAARDGIIPERICHNDCKINNILIDDESSEALCVIDLDTVMPGTPLYDLGDLIRTVSAGAVEDERDLSKVKFDPVFFEALMEGYLSRALEFLNEAELALACESGRNLTQIMGLRFLTDYLEGDVYYRISRPEQNLDRCRSQIALIKSMDSGRQKAELIVEKIHRNCPPKPL